MTKARATELRALIGEAMIWMLYDPFCLGFADGAMLTGMFWLMSIDRRNSKRQRGGS